MTMYDIKKNSKIYAVFTAQMKSRQGFFETHCMHISHICEFHDG